MIKVREIQIGDMAYVRKNPYEGAVKTYPDLPVPAHSFTCLYNGEIVAVGGIAILWEGVGEAWIIMTNSCRNIETFGLIAFRAIKKKLESLIEENGIWRCEAQARADFPKASKFIEALDFKKDCVRKKYLPDGTDMILYSKVTDDN